jgi:E3 ubiquitin-protein ligase RNF220
MRENSQQQFGVYVSGRKQHRADPACCPICGITIRIGEFEAHYLQEVERLMKLTIGPKGAGPSSTQNSEFSPSGSETAVAGGTTAESRWEVSFTFDIFINNTKSIKSLICYINSAKEVDLKSFYLIFLGIQQTCKLSIFVKALWRVSRV